MPATYRQFCKLENALTTMDIYRSLFMVGLIFRAEAEVKTLSEESMGRCQHLIKHCFSGMMSDKSRYLNHSGYQEEDYEEFISKFNFDHEVTF